MIVKNSTIMRRAQDALHLLYACWGWLRYGHKGKGMRMIGITGTDGKSSTVLMTAHILAAAGYKTAYISSVAMSDGVASWPNTLKMTTPGKGYIHRFLASAKEKGATHAVLEITSEGIKQHRHRFVRRGRSCRSWTARSGRIVRRIREVRSVFRASHLPTGLFKTDREDIRTAPDGNVATQRRLCSGIGSR